MVSSILGNASYNTNNTIAETRILVHGLPASLLFTQRQGAKVIPSLCEVFN